MAKKTLILNNSSITQKINRIAYQIYEDNYEEKEIIVAGISSNGYLLSERIVEQLKKISPFNITHTKITINKPAPLDTAITLDIKEELLNDKVVILVDDVLNSGKTLIYGVKYFLNFPVKRLSTVVLVDRNHRRYPIGIHYVGLSLSTTLQNQVSVEFSKSGEISAYLS